MNKSMTENLPLREPIDELFFNQSSRIFDFVSTPETEQFEGSIFNSNQGPNSLLIKTLNTKINENKALDDSIYSYQTHPPYNQSGTLPRNPMLSSPSCPSCRPLSPIYNSLSDKASSSKSLTDYSSTSIQPNLSQSSDDENDIYEKYQTLFSHILHQTKSLDAVRQLIYPPSNRNNISQSMLTSHIRVRLIANRIDSSIQCDTKPPGCKKSVVEQDRQSNFDFDRYAI